MDNGHKMYPVFINLESKLCVVVGAGNVAKRKVLRLLAYGGIVSVVGLRACPEIKLLAKESKIKLLLKKYESKDIDGASIVIAASDDRCLNKAVAKDGLSKNLLVNVVDNFALGNIYLPSIVRKNGIQIAISTSGKSPGYAKAMRIALEDFLRDEYILGLKLFAALREIGRDSVAMGEDKNVNIDGIIASGFLECLKNKEFSRALALLKLHLPGQEDVVEDVFLSVIGQ